MSAQLCVFDSTPYESRAEPANMVREQNKPTSAPQAIFASGRVQHDAPAAEAPDLRLVHYNDVYHVDGASAEPVGGIARFMTLVKEYQQGAQFQDQPALLTLFSGDAFNPSLESSVTKGWSTSPPMSARAPR